MKTNFGAGRPPMLVLVALLFTGGSAVQAQTLTFKDELAVRWEAMQKKIVDLAEAMPADRYGYKPTPEVRTFGEQLAHIAESNFLRISEVTGEKPPAAGHHGHAAGKAEVIRLLQDSFDFGGRALSAMTPAAAEVVPTQVQGRATRQNIIVQALLNANDHYGQLVVYLRLNGIVPPATTERNERQPRSGPGSP